MTDGFSNINCVITIEKKTSTPVDFTSDIFNYSESPLTRTVEYTKVIGGLILRKVDTILSKEISFDFIVDDLSFNNLWSINDTPAGFDYLDDSLYKIQLSFTSGASYHAKCYYNCTITELSHKMEDEVLKGTIKFTLPLKDLEGNSNYYETETSSNVTAYDTLMGY